MTTGFTRGGALGRGVRRSLDSVPAEGVLGARVALAKRLADAADTAARSGDVRAFTAAAKELDALLDKIGRYDDKPESVGGNEREPAQSEGLEGLLGAGPALGDDA